LKEKNLQCQSRPTSGMARSAFHVLLILIAGLLVYSNTFQVPFFIDANYITENPFVRDIHFPVEQLKNLNLDFYSHTNHRYVPFLTFALNYRLHGFDVLGYHVVNIFFHLMTALTLYAFVVLTFSTPLLAESRLKNQRFFLAFFTALIFTVHPLMTEAVNWIWQRAAVMAAFFYLASLAAYVRARLEKKRGWLRSSFYLLSILAVILGMKSKQNVFTVPIMIVLYEFVFFRDSLKPRIMRLMPYLLTLFIIPYAYLFSMGFSYAGFTKGYINPTGMEVTRLEYLFTQFTVLVSYLRRIFLPFDIPFYEAYPIVGSFFRMPVLLSFFFVAALFALSLYLIMRFKTRQPDLVLVGFGILWFFVTNAVESSIVPFTVVIANYRAYLPAIGIILSMVTTVCLITAQVSMMGRRAAFGCSLVLILFLAYTCYGRNAIWRTEITLSRDAVQHSPDSPQAHLMFGLAYKRAGMVAEAREEYEIAYRLDEERMAAQPRAETDNSAAGGIALLKRSLRPGDGDSYYRLAVAYYRAGQYQDSLEALQKAIEFAPDHSGAHYYSGLIHHEQGHYDQAIREYGETLKFEPDFVPARTNLGGVYAQLGRYEKGIAELQSALHIQPNYAEAHKYLGLIYQDLGRFEDALAPLLEAVRINPEYAEAHNSLGEVYAQLGKTREAVQAFRTALRLNPKLVMAQRNLQRLQEVPGGQ